MASDSDDELHYIDTGTINATAVAVTSSSGRGINLLTSSADTTKSLGTWMFDKKSRQRKYIALTGKVYTGADAMKVARADQASDRHPARSVRNELKLKMGLVTPEAVDALCSITMDLDHHLLEKLSNWGVPDLVVSRYARNKVTKLFLWQIECLTVDCNKVLTGKQHLIYSAPTSGGKTLVSEILMLRRLAQWVLPPAAAAGPGESSTVATNRHTIFFVVPFVALAEEKATYFQEMWQDMNIGVKAFHGDGGDLTGNVLSEDVEVAVCTIERANILLTQLLDEGREDQLKMVVIDEIHMLADAQRGFLLEVMLSKVKYLLNDSVQVVGMSATLPNIADLAGWLGASLYVTQYRPVDLSVRVCMNKTLYTVAKAPVDVSSYQPQSTSSATATSDATNAAAITAVTTEAPTTEAGSIGPNVSTEDGADQRAVADTEAPMDVVNESEASERINITITSNTEAAAAAIVPPAFTVQYSYDSTVGLLPEDPDGMKRLCLDTVAAGKSAMLFCNSKRRSEVCATAVADAVHLHMQQVAPGYRPPAALRTGRLALVESLAQTPVGLCPVLRQTLPYGVAYHHAGLTLDERKVVEDGFRQGLVQVLCTTSTLSAGVNMPAHRVIIRSPRMGDKFLNVSGFRQMCGRAGRMGYDSVGEAILMIMSNNKTEKAIADQLLTADLDPLLSSLHIGSGGGLEKLLLEMVSCGRLQNESQVLAFIDCTLMRVQHPPTVVQNCTREALIFLKREQFVQSLSEGRLSPTPLGIATTVSGIAPKDATQILRPLMEARAKLILKGGLHPVFLVTPPSTPIEPDWKNYEKVLHVLYQEHPDAEAVAAYLGIERGQLCTYAFNPPPRTGSASAKAQLYRRFFSAILLFTLVQEWPITRVTRLITNVTRGQLQQLQKDAAVFCGMTVVFCRKLNWPMLAACLEDFSARLNYGAHKDILPLVRLGPEVTPARARAFLRDGIESALDVMQAGLDTLTELLVDSLPYDGKDPLLVSANLGNANDSGKQGGGDPRSKEVARAMCERLARKIISRAREYLQDEAARLCAQAQDDW